jgi:glucosyl-3-phosphoglycerate synthase
MGVVAGIGTYHHGDFDAADLAARRGDTTISVCLPARNEADTIGPIVDVLVGELQGGVGLVDEVVVVDDHSTDGTAKIADDAGATVVVAEDVLADHGDGHGKGEAMWKSLYASTGDLVVWCDADVTSFSAGYVVGMVGVLLTRPEVQFVKAFYDRPLQAGDGGGRVTELVARPVLSLLFPELATIRQPLAGEYGGRRSALEQLPFVEGYGVDLALMVDVVRTFGVDAIAQVDLGVRLHRNRTLAELGPQALSVLHTALHRADPNLVGDTAELVRPGLDPVELTLAERPPLASVDEYAARNA